MNMQCHENKIHDNWKDNTVNILISLVKSEENRFVKISIQIAQKDHLKSGCTIRNSCEAVDTYVVYSTRCSVLSMAVPCGINVSGKLRFSAVVPKIGVMN